VLNGSGRCGGPADRKKAEAGTQALHIEMTAQKGEEVGRKPDIGSEGAGVLYGKV